MPQNISAAVNYDCVNCLSYALATQLFVTLDGPLSDAGNQQIAALWQQIAEFGTHITEVPLSEIKDRLTAYEQQILDVIEKEQGPLTPDDPAATPSGDSTAAVGEQRRRLADGRGHRRRRPQRRGLADRGQHRCQRRQHVGGQHGREQHRPADPSSATVDGPDARPGPAVTVVGHGRLADGRRRRRGRRVGHALRAGQRTQTVTTFDVRAL